jgi:hypothetical protein
VATKSLREQYPLFFGVFIWIFLGLGMVLLVVARCVPEGPASPPQQDSCFGDSCVPGNADIEPEPNWGD